MKGLFRHHPERQWVELEDCKCCQGGQRSYEANCIAHDNLSTGHVHLRELNSGHLPIWPSNI